LSRHGDDTHVHLLLQLRISGAVSPVPKTSLWRDAHSREGLSFCLFQVKAPFFESKNLSLSHYIPPPLPPTCAQELVTGSSSVVVTSSVQCHTHLFSTQIHILLRFILRSVKYISSGLPNKTLYRCIIICHTCYVVRPIFVVVLSVIETVML
jgi:hypothetical protein